MNFCMVAITTLSIPPVDDYPKGGACSVGNVGHSEEDAQPIANEKVPDS